MSPPLVSIGVPTYNRAASLERAVRSVLAQTHEAIEVVISDNASTDATEAVARTLCAGDRRVRYVRAPENRGPVANFNAVIAELRGEYAMLLADDDWLDPDYVERCLAGLRARPDHALVGGLPRYFAADGTTRDGLRIDLQEGTAGARLRRYFREVDDNGIFYGLMRREHMVRAAPMRDVLGADWLFVAGVAHAGKVAMLPDTRVHRALGGTSRSIGQILTTVSGVPPAMRRIPYVHTAAAVFGDMAWRSPAYDGTSRPARLWLALTVAPCAMRWKGSAWLLLGPPLVRVSRRRRGRWLRRPLAWAVGRGGEV